MRCAPLGPVICAIVLLRFSTGSTTSCISLRNSSACPKFVDNFFDSTLSEYPFLSELSSTKAFDDALLNYIKQTFPVSKFRDQFQCRSFGLHEIYYSRFTRTILCASIVQLSRQSCGPDQDMATVCADTCAAYAESEATVLSSRQCGLSLTDDIIERVRQDYSLCSTPSAAYNLRSCVDGLSNEPERCGFQDDTQQLCNFCATSQLNATNNCCDNLSPDSCNGVTIQRHPPVIVISPGETGDHTSSPGLSKGLVAAIAICALLALLGLAAVFVLLCWKKQRAASLRHRLQTLNRPRTGLHNNGPQAVRTEVSRLPTTQVVAAYRDVHTTTTSGESTSDQLTTTSSSGYTLKRRTVESDQSTAFSPFSGIHERDYPSSIGLLSGDPSSSTLSLRNPKTFFDQYSEAVIGVGSKVKCIHEYEPVLPDELRTKVGDRLHVSEIFDDSWCKGYVIGASDQEPKAFPIVCVCAESFVPEHNIAQPSKRISSATLQGRDSPSLPRVLEESGTTTITTTTTTETRPDLPKRGSTSRFKEHVSQKSS